MTTTMNALNSSSIRQVEFIRLTMPSNTYTFCNAAAPITVNSITFSNLGSLLQLGDIKSNIKATSSDLSISLSGVDGTNISIVLSSDIKGSKIEVWRGFLDSNNQIITTPTQQFFKRYQGIVSNYSITEDWNEEARTRVATVGLSCASFRTILENRVGGIRTTPNSWQSQYPNDTSMNRVQSIAGAYFDFGGPVTSSGSQATSNTPSQYRFGQ
ncbi:hypothetical protein UFOVP70_38 [uncultured Caudovirales phage]|uniref:Uncharacterized protein n=1 Tax=uncultured Caudovirales phage TaxID=2100421 RepID=A0A6J5KV58_9CAUD|nr:hypothetical protein UFOVP70_38 [uncultured Caudovirales phage]